MTRELPASRLLWCVAGVLGGLAVLFAVLGFWLEPWIEQAIQRTVDGGRSQTIALAVIALLVADIVLPVPASVVCTAAGSTLGVWTGALTVWVGLTLGAFAGYALGRVGLARFVSGGAGERHSTAMEHSPWILALCRPLPLLAESTVIAAGAARLSLDRFLVPVVAANGLLALLWTGLGAVARSEGWTGLALSVAAVLPVAAAAWWRFRPRTATRPVD